MKQKKIEGLDYKIKDFFQKVEQKVDQEQKVRK